MKLSCRKASQYISLALDGALSDARQEALRTHLAECASCRKAEREHRRLSQDLESIRSPAPPTGYAAGLRERIRGEIMGGSRTGVSTAFRAVAMAVIAVLAVAVGLLSREVTHAHRTIAGLSGVQHDGAAQREPGMTSAITLALQRNGTVWRDADEHVHAFRLVQEYLGGEMRWMAVDGDQVEIGISGSPTAQPGVYDGNNRLVVLACRYLKRDAGGAVEVLSNPQFVMQSGEEMTVRLAGKDGGSFAYRIGALVEEDGRIRADVSFARDAPRSQGRQGIEPRFASSFELVDGEPVLVGASADASSREELYLWSVSRQVVSGRTIVPGREAGSL